ncbi:hypothetical protein RHMOL_Rhmol08G0182500 [Rhododendron molle]|uniref:Uncharacterized protein n=1 Tax=Rhododendron molle TaxID=49168 RepID=A0ACC0MPN1_RHOML|nr:hypothetical protein RHMOL_Rhmol08G0182500 [Rhododendron molle]
MFVGASPQRNTPLRFAGTKFGDQTRQRPSNLGRDLPSSVETIPKLGRNLQGSVEIFQARQATLHRSASSYPKLGSYLPQLGGHLPKLDEAR